MEMTSYSRGVELLISRNLFFGNEGSAITFVRPFTDFGTSQFQASGAFRIYNGVTGPGIPFGTINEFFLGRSDGDAFGLNETNIAVPLGYEFDSPLQFTATFANHSFESLTLIPGSYEWNWGSGANADSVTVNIMIPEPTTFAFLGIGVLGFVLARERKTTTCVRLD